MYFIFYRKNVIDLSEWMHKSYLNNNEVIHKIAIQSSLKNEDEYLVTDNEEPMINFPITT